jgi:arsenate reductase
MKKVLILCTGNSCRSIMAEGLVNKYLFSKGVKAFSAGSRPTGFIVDNVQKILEQEGAWSDKFYSKSIDEVNKFAPFDLVVTVCDSAQRVCPNYQNTKKQIHFGIEDPFLGSFEKFEETRDIIKEQLIPIIKQELAL